MHAISHSQQGTGISYEPSSLALHLSSLIIEPKMNSINNHISTFMVSDGNDDLKESLHSERRHTIKDNVSWNSDQNVNVNIGSLGKLTSIKRFKGCQRRVANGSDASFSYSLAPID